VAVTDWLIDKSALVRWGNSPDAQEWAGRVERGLVRITTMTRLEVGHSARTAAEARSVFGTPPIMMPVEHLTPAIEDRALEVQLLLANKGHHRAPSIPDLLIAATAELASLTVLHVDKDFDLIAELTGQDCERLRATSS
jgi:predicted nucleic acid-binding protein